MTTTDALHDMFVELRAQLPPLPSLISDGDLRMHWLSAMRQLLQAMPPEPRWACTVLLANDLVTTRYRGMPLSMAYGWLAREFGVEDVT